MESGPVHVDVHNAVATVTLSRPEAMNALDVPTKLALMSALDQVARDPAVRAVVLTGSGRAFCVGQDLREHAENLRQAQAAAEQGTGSVADLASTVTDHYNPIVLSLAQMPKPVIAAINGVAAGAGVSFALACDFQIMAHSATFAFAFTGIGLSCDSGMSWHLPRLVGPSRARDLLMRPRTLEATEVLELGLVTELVPSDDVLHRARALAAELAAGPTVAYAAVREALAFSATHPLAESLAHEAELMGSTGSTTDHRRAVESFLAKERPVFEGR